MSHENRMTKIGSVSESMANIVSKRTEMSSIHRNIIPNFTRPSTIVTTQAMMRYWRI